jgi:hypothetical protein
MTSFSTLKAKPVLLPYCQQTSTFKKHTTLFLIEKPHTIYFNDAGEWKAFIKIAETIFLYGEGKSKSTHWKQNETIAKERALHMVY